MLDGTCENFTSAECNILFPREQRRSGSNVCIAAKPFFCGTRYSPVSFTGKSVDQDDQGDYTDSQQLTCGDADIQKGIMSTNLSKAYHSKNRSLLKGCRDKYNTLKREMVCFKIADSASSCDRIRERGERR